uniref:Band 7 domain-containing protein n=1 Tax=Arcella intermedia TaxID=1963864 RepID=A0A6B2LBS4_9EUKA
MDEHQPDGNVSLMSCAVGALCLPITLFASLFTVQENQEVVVLNFGKYVEVVKDPGIHWSCCFGRDLIPISKAKISTELPVSKVIDKNGNPVMVSGVVFYYFSNTRKAALDIFDPQAFVRDQATAVMKQIVSQYPYEHHLPHPKQHKKYTDNDQTESPSAKITLLDDTDEESNDELPCLKNDTNVISSALVRELQKRVKIAGATIDNFRFNEVSYASEVSAALLKRQQAEAIITARSTLVEGAVHIASAAISRLENHGVQITSQEKTRIVSNLLTVVCADEHVSPALVLGST